MNIYAPIFRKNMDFMNNPGLNAKNITEGKILHKKLF